MDELQSIPGVGRNMAAHLNALGFRGLYAEGRIEDPEQLKWWNWKD